MKKVAVCIFAKLPRAGHVKTRLASSIGDEAAVTLAEAFLEDTITLATSFADTSVIVAFDEPAPADRQKADVRYELQGAGDLGARLELVLRRALETHAVAVALGTDSPGIPRAFVAAALERLTGASEPTALLGPTVDGGYWILGTTRLDAGALAGVRWSTSDTFADTERALRRAGLDVVHGERWFDVDEAADLERLRASIACGESLAPATARALAKLSREERRPTER